jgi:ureidoacrylate peracid hydrolase
MNAPVLDRAADARGALADWIAPGRTAVLAIDMQVDFAEADGALGRAGLDMSVVQPALATAERLVEAARAAGVPVVFVGLMTRPEQDSPAWRTRMLRQGGDPDDESALCRVGERGADFVGPMPRSGELVIGKSRYSGFFGTELNARLKAMGVDTVVVCGLTTECCVDCTVRDAFHLDYHVFIATDACAAYEPDLHAGALKSLELSCALLAATDELAAAWGDYAAHG